MRNSLIAAFVLLACLVAFAVAVPTPSDQRSVLPSRVYTVELIVATLDFADEIRSYMSRELRSLGDVKLVEAGGEYILEVHALELSLDNGTSPGSGKAGVFGSE